MALTKRLYILARKRDCNSYDVVNSVIVRATSPTEARKLASEQRMDEGADTWLHPAFSSCTTLTTKGASKVICIDSTNG